MEPGTFDRFLKNCRCPFEEPGFWMPCSVVTTKVLAGAVRFGLTFRSSRTSNTLLLPVLALCVCRRLNSNVMRLPGHDDDNGLLGSPVAAHPLDGPTPPSCTHSLAAAAPRLLRGRVPLGAALPPILTRPLVVHAPQASRPLPAPRRPSSTLWNTACSAWRRPPLGQNRLRSGAGTHNLSFKPTWLTLCLFSPIRHAA